MTENILKQHMLEGGFIESERLDIAYYSKIDDEFLLRFKVGMEYDTIPVILDFQYISTFEQTSKKSNKFLLNNDFKIPYKIYIGKSNILDDKNKNNVVFKNLKLRELENDKRELKKQIKKIDRNIFYLIKE